MSASPSPRPSDTLYSFLHTYGFLPTGVAITGAFSGFDSHVRLTSYIRPLEQVGGLMLENYKAGVIKDHQVVVHDIVKVRNELMNMTRGKVSPGALAMSQYMKADAPTEADLRLKYSRQLAASPFSREVSEMIMSKAVSPNPTVTAAALRNRWLGMSAFTIMGPAQLTWVIYRAPSEDRIYEGFRSASEVVGGTLGMENGPSSLGSLQNDGPKARSQAGVVPARNI